MEPFIRVVCDLSKHWQQQLHSLGGAASMPEQQQDAHRLRRLPVVHTARMLSAPADRSTRLPRRVSFGPPLCSLTQGLLRTARRPGQQQPKDGSGSVQDSSSGSSGGAAPGGGSGGDHGSGATSGGGFGGKRGGSGKDGKGQEEDERILISEVGGRADTSRLIVVYNYTYGWCAYVYSWYYYHQRRGAACCSNNVLPKMASPHRGHKELLTQILLLMFRWQ